MNLSSLLWQRHVKVVCFGLLAFVLLTIRFSPNWGAFQRGLRGAKDHISSPAQSLAIDRAILSGHSARGFYVTRQALDLRTEIDDPNHKIVRWRLLVPLLGYVLHLPGYLILSLAHLGCLALIIVLANIGSRTRGAPGRPLSEATHLAVIAGASAPFFTSMGWLGYYDSWLALALLGVAFARWRWIVLTACLLAPWIDERFVIGLPLALCVRRIQSNPAAESNAAWFRQQALLPLSLVIGYAAFRLSLGGSGGSQTVGDYLNQFVFAGNVSVGRRLYGAWEGLRLSWLLVAAAILGTWRASFATNRLQARLLIGGIVITASIGLFTALDLSRSMVLIIPVVPLGWNFAARAPWWNRFHVAPLLAAAALVVPASHVVGKYSIPVDNGWSPSLPLTGAQNNLGVIFAYGKGVPQDSAAAATWYRKSAEQGNAVAQTNLACMYAAGNGVQKNSAAAMSWFRTAAEQNYAEAQNNLGAMYANGDGVPKDSAEAVKWYRKAAAQGSASAQANLGLLYATGDSVPKDTAEALKWYRQAVEQGNVVAQCNLGAMYATGNGVPQDRAEAVNWYRQAAEQDSAVAQYNLGVMLATDDTTPNLVQGHFWLSVARANGYEAAQADLVNIERKMTPEDIATALKLVRDRFEKLPKK